MAFGAIVGVAAVLLLSFLLANVIATIMARARDVRVESKRNTLAAAASARAPGTRFPVTIITGFLGAGKTVLLNRILSNPQGKRICVIENEAGAVSIDHALIAGTRTAAGTGAVSVTVLKNGCMCCTGGGSGDELERTLDKLLAALGNDASTPAPFDHVIVETSGLVDPAPLIQTFFRCGRPCAYLLVWVWWSARACVPPLLCC